MISCVRAGPTTDDRAGEDAAALAARVRGIPEPRLRITAAAEALELPPGQAVALIDRLVALGGEERSGHRAALDAVLRVLADAGQLGYERRAELYAAAIEAGLAEVALLLMDAAPPAPGTEELERGAGEERPLAPRGRPLTLGERKALARGHRRELLLQLVRDPHPDVIAVLLENPRLTEPDVVRLASRRPMLPGGLAAIADSERWRGRPAVRRALVLNPCTPVPLAARLVTTLGDAELRAVARDPSLPGLLRAHAAGVLARRRA